MGGPHGLGSGQWYCAGHARHDPACPAGISAPPPCRGVAGVPALTGALVAGVVGLDKLKPPVAAGAGAANEAFVSLLGAGAGDANVKPPAAGARAGPFVSAGAGAAAVLKLNPPDGAGARTQMRQVAVLIPQDEQ